MLTIIESELASANFSPEEDTMMPLSLAEMNKAQVVRRIGGSPEVKKHLADLGFNIGSEVSVISSLGGNLIVKVRESRVAVSNELAMRIMV